METLTEKTFVINATEDMGDKMKLKTSVGDTSIFKKKQDGTPTKAFTQLERIKIGQQVSAMFKKSGKYENLMYFKSDEHGTPNNYGTEQEQPKEEAIPQEVAKNATETKLDMIMKLLVELNRKVDVLVPNPPAEEEDPFAGMDIE